MNGPADLSRGLLRKAASDLAALDASLSAGSYDTACFHAQQAGEKSLKAFLAHRSVPFPYTHNLAKLIEICAQFDPAFRSLLPLAAPLTPYAVELRYDDAFWPPLETARQARAAAAAIQAFVLKRLPKDMMQTGE